MRPFLFLAALSLTVTPTQASQTSDVVLRHPYPDHPAVQCRPGERNEMMVTGEVASPSVRSTVPPPPPPPPPPATITRSDGSVVLATEGYASTRVAVAPYVQGEPQDWERYDGEPVSNVVRAADNPVSTFSVDVDTGSYSNARRFLKDGSLPPSAAVRTEEFLNYFRYDYPLPTDRTRPFSVSVDTAATPWNAATKLMRVGIRGYDVARDQRPDANLTFLVDVSGSMNSPDKLPLLKDALVGMTNELNANDRVSIVVYAGASGVVLSPTADKQAVKLALDCLSAGGSTAGAAGLELAYKVARSSFVKDGINRVILATDGDFNVGITDRDRLKDFIVEQRKSGITLTTLGFGRGNYNEAMMEQIADHGNGNYGYIDSLMEARKLLDQELSSTLFTIAGDVKIQVEFNPAMVSEYRLIGYENRALAEEDFDNDAVDAGDIGAGHQVTALYEIVPAGAKGWLPDRRYGEKTVASSNRAEAAWLKLRYKLPGEDQSRLIERPVPASALRTNEAPRGDFAFQAAVAAFGQRLRGDEMLADFSFDEIAALAGHHADYWREEFVQLVGLAETRSVVPDGSR